MGTDFTGMQTEDFTVLAPHPADVTHGYRFAVSGEFLVWAQGKLDKDIKPLGIKLQDIFPRFGVEFSDTAIGKDERGIFNVKGSPAQIPEYQVFRVHDVLLWWSFHVGHVKGNYLV